MNLKSTLKLLKLNESTISMILGALVIIVVGMLVVNYFKNSESGTTFPDGINTEEITLPTTHVVNEGDTLWSIAEKYYDSGYNWTDIAEANNLTSADVITKGQELVIPDVKPKTIDEPEPTESAIAEVPEPTLAPVATPKATEEPEATTAPTIAPEEEEEAPTEIAGDTYTVVRGDNLWTIAERAYGDGYKWVEIARANNLANPDLIHAGNVFTLPR